MSIARCSRISSLRILQAGLVSSLHRMRCLTSSLKPSFPRNFNTTTCNREPSINRISRALDPKSLMSDLESEIFNYTTGHFLANDAYHLRKRSHVFDIPGLFEIIAEEMNCQTEQIVGFRKLGEGDLNRIYLVTLDTGFQLTARIPYPLVAPKTYVVASEVATMDFLRSKGLPIPQVYAYSFTPHNEAKTEYSLMEYIEGSDLSKIWQKWSDLKEVEIISLMDQLATFESTMMSISFPAGGSIYYAKDLMLLAGNEGIPLNEQVESSTLKKKQFCLGPDVSTSLWYGRREQLDVFRGPYKDAKSVLLTGAKKELAYLHQFGAPREPYDRMRRQFYEYEKQDPLAHVKNLELYLRLATWLVPNDDGLNTFCIRHPDLTDSNIRVSRDSGDLQIISLLDWQHAAVLPLFLYAGMPEGFQHYEDEISRKMIRPQLPDDFDNLPEDDQDRERELFHRRLVHFHYNLSTATYNRVHYKGLAYPLNPLCRRVVNYASVPWEGETIDFLCALIDCLRHWEEFVTDGTPCPVAFTEDDVAAAENLHQKLASVESNWRSLKEMIGFGQELWVPVTHYETAKALCQQMKQRTLEACEQDDELTNEDWAVIDANWPFDDMDEEELEDYR